MATYERTTVLTAHFDVSDVTTINIRGAIRDVYGPGEPVKILSTHADWH